MSNSIQKKNFNKLLNHFIRNNELGHHNGKDELVLYNVCFDEVKNILIAIKVLIPDNEFKASYYDVYKTVEPCFIDEKEYFNVLIKVRK